MADIRSIFTAVAGQADLTIDSNITPKITVNLADILVPGQPSQTAIQSNNPLLMRIIRPEIAIQSVGIERSYAPYGKPQAGMYAMIGLGLFIACLTGGATTWLFCKNYAV